MTQPNRHLLGIDIGSTGCKCTIYDLKGSRIATAYHDYPMIHPHPGWVEEDPRDWWEACVKNLSSLWEKPGVHPEDVLAVGVSCTNSIIPIGDNGEALHNAIIQIDQRAIPEAQWIREHIGQEKIFASTRNRIAPGTFSLPTILWMKEHRSEIFKKTKKFVVPGGYIVLKLTGLFSIDTSRMATTLLGNIETCEWDHEIARSSGIPLELLPKIYKSTDIIGGVTAEAAKLTGLISGTPVVAGAMDTVAAAVGSGALAPGTAFLTVGTAARMCLSVDDTRFLDDRFLNCPHAEPGRWLSIAVTNCAGGSLRWFRDNLSGEKVQEELAAGGNGYEALNQAAQSAKPGSKGLIYLPYLSGERAPIWDPYARGVYFGLSLATTRDELARATMEGVAFSLRHSLELWRENGVLPERIALSGGGANSEIWSSIMADVLDFPLHRLDISETETLGAALLAGMGTGLIDNPQKIYEELTRTDERIEPNPKNRELYRGLYGLYRSIYLHLKEDYFQLDQLLSRERETES